MLLSLLRTAVAWAVFLAVLLAAWDSALVGLVARLDDAAAQAANAGAKPLRRTFLAALVAYGYVAVWFRVLVLLLLLFTAAMVVRLASRFAINDYVHALLMWASDAALLFGAIARRHIPFHAGLLALLCVAMLLPALFYVRDADLADPRRRLVAKGYVLLFVAAALQVSAYALYALVCLITTAV